MARNASGKNLTHELVEKIGTMIVRGDAIAGENLPIEAELSTMFESSRTVTREAVKMLTAKGLVGQKPKRGTYVQPESNWNFLDPDVLEWILQRQFSPTLLREFLVVRRAIEPAAAVEVVNHASDETIAAIGAALQHFRDVKPGTEESVEADIAFHISILEGSNNRFLQQFSPMVRTALRYSIRAVDREKGRVADVDAHARIFRAIAKRNAKLAHRLNVELMDEAIEMIERAEKRARAKA